MRSTKTTSWRGRGALFVLLPLLAIALASCSRHTSLTVRADLVPFMTTGQRQASISYPTGSLDIQLPVSTTPPNPGASIDLTQLGVPASAASAIDAFALDLAATVDPTTNVDAGTASIFVAPSNATNAFQSAYLVTQVDTPALTANQTATVTAAVRLDAQTNPGALQYIQSGAFRLGVEIQANAASAGSADVELTRMVVAVSAPPGWALP
ncbi:MAG TPA: hypothetical protein VKA00_07370 [Trueperaceae bacterium]|nr:hypothetical protein [Trueperaceae bacterium]